MEKICVVQWRWGQKGKGDGSRGSAMELGTEQGLDMEEKTER